jgi:hypothetical protein
MYQHVQNQPARKRQRVSRACDFCHARGLKCHRSASVSDQYRGISSCLTCIDCKVPCKTDRPIRKRGRKPGFASSSGSVNGHEQEYQSIGLERNDQNSIESLNLETLDSIYDFRSLSFVQRLVRIYCDTMYQC